MADNYQLAIIGSGSGGREAIRLAAQSGLRTALIERDRVGGTCFHSGCYAVLSLQACAREFRDRWRSGRFGNKVDLLRETLRDWMIAKSNVSGRLVDEFRAELERPGIDLYHGHGQFLDDRTLQIVETSGGIKTITAETVIIATGSRAVFSGGPGPRSVNSEQLLRIESLPRSLAIVGAGYIGCEFASIYRTLGCAVTLIEKENRVLPSWEAEAGELVRQMLEMRGITLHLERQVSLSQIQEDEEGVRIPTSGGPVTADLLLVATGRKPNLEGLGLGALATDEGSFLKVDSQMRLSRRGLYAVGDVNGISLLDSTAMSQASTAINSILGRESRFEAQWTPRCIHTEPAIAAVGLTADEAAAQKLEYLVIADTIRLASDLERSIVDPEPTFLKAVVDARSRCLIGLLAVGDHAPVIVNIATIAMRSGLTIDELLQMPLIQPSASQALTGLLRRAI